MASLSTSASSLHRDVRSDAHDSKRFKDQKNKWALGTRPLYGVKRDLVQINDPIDPRAKVRPERHYPRCSCCYGPSHINPRKEDAIREINYSGRGLSKSISDLLPNDSTSPRSPDESSIMYSFDAPSAPRKAVGLDGLVDKAEKEWKSRETDRIVRNEYAVLDNLGEFSVISKGKGKKSSPRQRAQSVTSYDEDDWERI